MKEKTYKVILSIVFLLMFIPTANAVGSGSGTIESINIMSDYAYVTLENVVSGTRPPCNSAGYDRHFSFNPAINTDAVLKVLLAAKLQGRPINIIGSIACYPFTDEEGNTFYIEKIDYFNIYFY